MRHPDITIWTAGPPTPVTKCTVQVNGGPGQAAPGGAAIYYYWIIAHYPIGSVISPWFIVRSAPKPLDVQRYIIISWEGVPGATNYDVLRQEGAAVPPPDASGAEALALGVTQTRVLDQGQTLTPYDITGLTHGSTVDGWAHMNNKDYSKPVLELWPTIRIKSVLFTDGSEQDSAGGGSGVSSVFGRVGVVTAQPGDYNATQISLAPAIGTWTTVQQAIQAIGSSGLWTQGTGGAIYYTGGNVGIKQTNPQYSLDIVGSINVTGGFFLNGTLFAGTGVPLMAAGVPPAMAQIATTAPRSPEQGQFWFDSRNRKLKLYYLTEWLEV